MDGLHKRVSVAAASTSVAFFGATLLQDSMKHLAHSGCLRLAIACPLLFETRRLAWWFDCWLPGGSRALSAACCRLLKCGRCSLWSCVVGGLRS